MSQIILNGILSGLLLSFLIGPVFFVLLETSIKKGAVNAVFINIGVLLTDVLYLLLAYFFAQEVLEKLQENEFVKYLAGLVFIGMGVVTILKRDKPSKKTEINVDEVLDDVDGVKDGKANLPERFKKRTALGLILKGMGLNAINPGVLLYWIAACAAATEQLHIEKGQMIYYFGATLGTMFGIDMLKIYFAGKLKNKLTQSMISNISIIIGIIFIVFGVLFFFRNI
ncbi:MAG: LysE family transporter [Flavobacteriales bacterium]|nr:LysE family transporter [Flavobacteriales bacterium]